MYKHYNTDDLYGVLLIVDRECRPRAARVLLVWIAISDISYILISKQCADLYKLAPSHVHTRHPAKHSVLSSGCQSSRYRPTSSRLLPSLVGQRHKESPQESFTSAKFNATIATTYIQYVWRLHAQRPELQAPRTRLAVGFLDAEPCLTRQGHARCTADRSFGSQAARFHF